VVHFFEYFAFFATLIELACLIAQVNDITGYTLSDKSLVDKVLRGETGAFATIIKNTEALTAQIVFKMITNAEDRKDVAQDIYLKVFNKLSGFRFESKLSTWIAQIGYNTCLSYLEKKKLVLPGNFQDDETDVLELIINKSNTQNNETEKVISKKELSFILKTEIENLPPVYKTLITLYHNEDLSYDEISEIVQLPEGTVKSYLFRARKMLKENLLAKYKKEEL
jgi:RNA polymerase sigma factor (sigma-70 family)